jgi:hypothetical protein
MSGAQPAPMRGTPRTRERLPTNHRQRELERLYGNSVRRRHIAVRADRTRPTKVDIVEGEDSASRRTRRDRDVVFVLSVTAVLRDELTDHVHRHDYWIGVAELALHDHSIEARQRSELFVSAANMDGLQGLDSSGSREPSNARVHARHRATTGTFHRVFDPKFCAHGREHEPKRVVTADQLAVRACFQRERQCIASLGSNRRFEEENRPRRTITKSSDPFFVVITFLGTPASRS